MPVEMTLLLILHKVNISLHMHIKYTIYTQLKARSTMLAAPFDAHIP